MKQETYIQCVQLKNMENISINLNIQVYYMQYKKTDEIYHSIIH